MVWLVEKKVVYHLLDLGFERIEIPVRVKFEYEVKEGVLVPDSLSTHTLYNRKAIERRYPRVKIGSLESAIDKRVKKEIMRHMKECGFSGESEDTGQQPLTS